MSLVCMTLVINGRYSEIQLQFFVGGYRLSVCMCCRTDKVFC